MELKQQNIFFITLLENEMRLKNVQNIKDKYIPKSNIFEAISKKKLSDEQLNKYIKKGFLTKKYIERVKRNQGNNIGGIGCTLSHMTLWYNLVESKNDYYIIMEDDADIKPTFLKDLAKIFDEINNNSIKLDYLTFFIHPHFEKKQNIFQKSIKENYKLISKCIPMYGAVGYLITRKGAKKILKYLKDKDNIRESDTILYNMIQSNLLKGFCANKKILNTLGAIGKKDFLLGNSKFGSTIWKKN